MDGRRKVTHILVVEDNPDHTELMAEAFAESSSSNQVHFVADGQSALAFARQEGHYASAPQPHLIILDLNLPGMPGDDVLRQLKAAPATAHIPVIIVTTSTAPDDVRLAYEHQAAAFVTKPLRYGDFLDTIRAVDAFWFRFVHYVRPLDAHIVIPSRNDYPANPQPPRRSL